jgi:hypothetical protein
VKHPRSGHKEDLRAGELEGHGVTLLGSDGGRNELEVATSWGLSSGTDEDDLLGR